MSISVGRQPRRIDDERATTYQPEERWLEDYRPEDCRMEDCEGD
jgi:hypothetical protein